MLVGRVPAFRSKSAGKVRSSRAVLLVGRASPRAESLGHWTLAISWTLVIGSLFIATSPAQPNPPQELTDSERLAFERNRDVGTFVVEGQDQLHP